MTSPFVGLQRRQVVDRLLEDYKTVAAGEGPRITFLEAPLGWGKTRLAHELYAELAQQQKDPYWPERIVEEEILDGLQVSQLRKRLVPPSFHVPKNTVPEWIWLAVATDPSSAARPEQACASIAQQLEPHIQPLLRKQNLSNAVARTLISSLGALLPIPANIDALIAAVSGTQQIVAEWWQGGAKTREVGGDSFNPTALLWKLLTSIWKESGKGGPPIILLIEDAQFLSESSVELIGSLLASHLPLLIVATGWPLALDERYEPFRRFVDAAPEELRRETLAPLTNEDGRRLISELHPGTDQQLIDVLVDRFASNPYALQLFLSNHDADRGRPFVHDDPEWLKTMDSSVHTELRSLLERAPKAQRSAVLVSALLGYRVPVEVGDAAILTQSDEYEIIDALQTDWMRRDNIDEQILAFVEPIRREAAKDLAGSTISPAKSQLILDAAVRRLEEVLTDDIPDPDRPLLERLYIELSASSTRRNEELLAECFIALLEYAWQHREYLVGKWAQGAAQEMIVFDRLSPESTARSRIAIAQGVRKFVSPNHETLEVLTQRAIDATLPLRESHPSLSVIALLERASMLRRKGSSHFDPARALELYEQAREVAPIEQLSPRARLRLLTSAYALHSAAGDKLAAYREALAAAAYCRAEPELGESIRFTSVADAYYYIARVDPRLSLQPTRELIDEMIRYFGTDNHMRVAATRKDLAARLLMTHRPEDIDEALTLADQSYELLRVVQGRHGRSALAALAVKGHALQRRAQVRWCAGDTEASLRDGESARAVAEQVIEARNVLEERRAAGILPRTRLAQARAWCGEEGALEEIQQCIEERLHHLNEDKETPAVLLLARSLRDAYRRYGRKTEASTVMEEFPLAFSEPYPA